MAPMMSPGIALVLNLAQEFYDNAHAYQHGADKSDSSCALQPTNVVKIGSCVVPQFTEYVELLRLDRYNRNVMPLRFRLKCWREMIFTSSICVGADYATHVICRSRPRCS